MLIQVSTPTSAAELRALYRATRAHFVAARPPVAEKPVSAVAPAARHLTPPARELRARFSGRATLRRVARHFGLTPAAIAGGARRHRLVIARWIVMHICVDVGGYTAARAGRLLGREHTTVLYGLHELAALLARDAALANEVALLARKCAPVAAGQGSA